MLAARHQEDHRPGRSTDERDRHGPRDDAGQGPQAAGQGRGPGGHRGRGRDLHRQGRRTGGLVRHRRRPAGRRRPRPGPGRGPADPAGRAVRRRQGRPARDGRGAAALPGGPAAQQGRRRLRVDPARLRAPQRPGAGRGAVHQPAPPGLHPDAGHPRAGVGPPGRVPPQLAGRLHRGRVTAPGRGRARGAVGRRGTHGDRRGLDRAGAGRPGGRGARRRGGGLPPRPRRALPPALGRRCRGGLRRRPARRPRRHPPRPHPSPPPPA